MKKNLLLALVAVCTFACTKDDKTSTATINYSFKQLNPSATINTEATSGVPIAAGSNGSVNWTSATLNIAKIEFSANYKGVISSYEAKNLLLVNPFSADSLIGTTNIEMGVYENLRFKITATESATNPFLVLNGTYIEASGTKIPVTVTINSALSFVKEFSRIEVASGTYVAVVTVELNNLIKGLTATDFGQTTRTGTNKAIIINATTNRPLFEKLTVRLPNTISLSVVKK